MAGFGVGKRAVILGAGPTGIGAAYRLNELGSEWHQFLLADGPL